jgi:hypothetical protein
MSDWIEKFAAQAPPIDDVRENAARCAEETARWERGERGPLRMPRGLIAGEFTDAEFGTAAEVATTVGDALTARGQRFRPEFAWSTAAKLLRNGWQRGHRLMAQVIVAGESC